MPRYRPPTRITTISMPYIALVTREDPDWQREKRNEVEYEFSRRTFRANPAVRGAYNDNDN